MNRAEQELSDIARMGDEFDSIRQKDSLGYVEIHIMAHQSINVPEFVANHRGHELELFNEYGDHEPLWPEKPQE